MSSSDVTTRKPGSASDWLPCLIYSPSADNLNNFIAKRRAFEENRELTPQELNTERAYKRSAVCTLLAKTRHLRRVNNSKTIDVLSQVKQQK